MNNKWCYLLLALHVCCMSTACQLHNCYMSTACLPRVYCMSAAWLRHVCRISAACLYRMSIPHICRMSTACLPMSITQHVYGRRTCTVTLQIMYPPWNMGCVIIKKIPSIYLKINEVKHNPKIFIWISSIRATVHMGDGLNSEYGIYDVRVMYG